MLIHQNELKVLRSFASRIVQATSEEGRYLLTIADEADAVVVGIAQPGWEDASLPNLGDTAAAAFDISQMTASKIAYPVWRSLSLPGNLRPRLPGFQRGLTGLIEPVATAHIALSIQSHACGDAILRMRLRWFATAETARLRAEM